MVSQGDSDTMLMWPRKLGMTTKDEYFYYSHRVTTMHCLSPTALLPKDNKTEITFQQEIRDGKVVRLLTNHEVCGGCYPSIHQRMKQLYAKLGRELVGFIRQASIVHEDACRVNQCLSCMNYFTAGCRREYAWQELKRSRRIESYLLLGNHPTFHDRSYECMNTTFIHSYRFAWLPWVWYCCMLHCCELHAGLMIFDETNGTRCDWTTCSTREKRTAICGIDRKMPQNFIQFMATRHAG